MSDLKLTELLEATGDRTTVAPPPISAMLTNTRRARRRRGVLVAATAAVAVATTISATLLVRSPGGAGSPAAPVESPTASQTGPAQVSADTNLEGTWVVDALVGANGQSVLDGFDGLRLTFHDGTMTGTNACNDVFGHYVQSGESGQDLRFPAEDLGSTLVGCQEPPLVQRLLDVRHVSGSPGVRSLHANNWMIIVQMHRPPSSSGPHSTDQTTLSREELNKATAIARQTVESEDATVTSATVTAGSGTVSDSNTGHRCTSGRLLHIKLIGTFPHIVTTGRPVKPGEDVDFTVTAVLMTADAETGEVCLRAVQTGDVEPEPGAMDIPLD